VQEVTDSPGARLIVVRQRTAGRPQADGKPLIQMPGYKF